MTTSKKKYILVIRIIIAVILIQTLRFKFTAHPDSVYIFTQSGMEPYGRICIGVLELIAGVLLLIPKTIWVGASTTIGLMVGAISIHLTKIGIIVNNDNGVLFITAVLTLVLSAIVLYSYRSDIPLLENQKE